MSRANNISQLLQAELSPTHLQVIDESHKHAGHAGAGDAIETHFHLIISSDKFAGLSRIKTHQMIYAILAAEFKNGLHALSIEVIQ